MNDLASFRALGISDVTLDALKKKGFEEPSPIQTLTIPLLLEGAKDVIGQAQTGTGKTAAFGIPIVECIHSGKGNPQALILAPTRELAIQIAEELNSIKGDRKLRIASFYGGQAIEIQLQRLRDGIDIAIGTPGRIIDLMERGKLKFDELRFAVLDEADEMLNMGFIEDIEKILAATPEDKRMLMFSATMPPEILSIAENFMREYEIVRTKSEQATVDLTEQIYFEVRRENKLEALSRIIDMEEELYAMVFCRTRCDVDELTEKLRLRGYGVEALHGDISQAQRLKVINSFKQKKFRILIATDVAARGIDVNDLTHVINYSMPQGTETYVHRIGRTGRAGRTGVAITFVTPAEYRHLTRIKRDTGSDIRKEDLPAPRDVVNAKKQRYIDKISAVIDDEKHKKSIGFAEELLASGHDITDILAAMLTLKFKNELDESNYADLSKRQEKRVRPDDRGHTRLFVGVGKADGFGAAKLLELIFELTGIRSYRLGKVECLDKFSFVNAEFADAERIIDAFRRRRGPTVEVARPQEGGEAPAEDKPFRRKKRDDEAPRRKEREKPVKPRRSLRDSLPELGDLPLKPKKSRKNR